MSGLRQCQGYSVFLLRSCHPPKASVVLHLLRQNGPMEWMEWVEMESMEWNQDTLGTFEVAATLGEEALGAQVISMASSPSDVLAVKLMQASASANANVTCRSIAVVGDGVIPSHLMSSLLVSSHLVSFGLISLDGCGRETAVVLPIAPPLLLASGRGCDRGSWPYQRLDECGEIGTRRPGGF